MKTLSELLQLSQTHNGRNKLRTMLAEALDWTWSPTEMWGFPPGECEATECPDYPNDFSACYEVENGLNGVQQDQFCNLLGWPANDVPHAVWKVAHASALQRTIALILTLQKPEPRPSISEFLSKTPH